MVGLQEFLCGGVKKKNYSWTALTLTAALILITKPEKTLING